MPLGLTLPIAAPYRGPLLATSILRRTRNPRYLLHGVVAGVVGVGADASIAVQPRPVPSGLAPQSALVAESVAAVADLDLVPLPVPATTDEADDVAPADADAPAPTADVEKAAPPPKPTIHTVEEGETLRMLAAKFGISPETIMAANNLR